jgi:hypothetical protein
MPTVARAAKRLRKLCARPPSIVATLQMATPSEISFGRERLSPKAPNTGEASM